MAFSRILPVLVLVLGSTSLAGCFGDDDCVAGDEACTCDGAGVCSWNCPDGGCDYEANGTGAATFTCDAGSCDLLATGQGDVVFDCLGGGCYAEATGQGAVDVSCAGGGCVVDCNGMGACTITECDDCECNGTLTGICG